jgi:hypothetical protein
MISTQSDSNGPTASVQSGTCGADEGVPAKKREKVEHVKKFVCHCGDAFRRKNDMDVSGYVSYVSGGEGG